jgi:hypothetical protein
VQVDAETLDIA